MSVTIDTNVLIYASNRTDPAYEPARALVEHLATGPEIFYLFWPTIMGYLRIATHPGILPQPLNPSDATSNITQLLAQPHIQTVGEEESFWEFYRIAAGNHARGNDVPDIHIVALMRQHGVNAIYTRDRDFRRFDDIELRDPFI